MDFSDYSLVVFEDCGFVDLLPLVYWREISALRCGTGTLGERICQVQGKGDSLSLVRPEFGIGAVGEGACLFVNARCLLFDAIAPADHAVVGRSGQEIAYVWADAELATRLFEIGFLVSRKLETTLAGVAQVECDIEILRYPWDLVQATSKTLVADWESGQRVLRPKRIYDGAYLLAEENISIGVGTVVMPGAVLDAENGPIIVGEDVTIKSNASLEGPLYIGDGSIVQPNAVIRPGTSIGPVCRVGGEVSCSILHSYSNKQHDGFLGHSYLGQWVNLGAATTTSNLKNTYGSVKVPINGIEVDSGQHYVGVTIGDFSKVGINTTFATGSVVGFSSSIFTTAIVPRFVPSFSWITSEGIFPVILEKGVTVAETVMGRRKVEMPDELKTLFRRISVLAKTFEKTE
jgi:UDP-N-acetylglucosamine diphosphorylase/glucosamine-1-phosphate N-acetyltransferase